ncbi:MAG: signal peptide peptidase SppA [Candidatus Diapherotrites archaeon]
MKKNDNTNTLILIGASAILFILIVFAVILLFPIGSDFGPPGFVAPGIAIIPLKGEITNSTGSFSADLSADEIVQMLDDADNDSSIGAILIDIDSPGGGVVPSKQIVYKVRSVKKPVYSYINSSGASGAYYVASATDYIMADEDSITGSIGVISMILNFEKLFDDLGIGVTVLKEGEFKAIGSPFKELSEDEESILQSILIQIYEGFKEDVLEFRGDKLTRSQLDSVADGRILSGRQAFQKNLVDELLTKEQAVDRAAELAGIKEPIIITYGKKDLSFLELFFSSGQAFGQGFISSIKTSDSIEVK